MRLNLGCAQFYRHGWLNVDLDRYVQADLREDATTLPSLAPATVEEIYAGHLLEHVDDVRATLTRWHDLLIPGGKLTVTVPDCRGAVKLWLERKNFPSLNCDSTEGIVQVTTGVTPGTRHKDMRLTAHRRVFDESTLRLCLEACGFVKVQSVDDHDCMVVPCSLLGWQIALEGYRAV